MDAVRRQLDTAIELWIEESDPVAIHTLVAAGYRILLDLCKHRGLPAPLLFEPSFVAPAMKAEWKNLIRKAETFFKHAEDDHDEVLKFSPTFTHLYLWDAISTYEKLEKKKTDLMQVFSTWYLLANEDVFRAAGLKLPEDIGQKELGSLPRRELSKCIFEALSRQRAQRIKGP